MVPNVASSKAKGPQKPRRDVRVLLQSQTFTGGGEFSGSLEGTITVDGTAYQVAPDVKIYEIGGGALPPGTVLHHRTVGLLGIVRDRSMIVSQIIVRPEGSSLVPANETIRTLPCYAGPR
jgi:hypothetical protein